MDFYIGQIFIDEYPEELYDWCNDQDTVTITEI